MPLDPQKYELRLTDRWADQLRFRLEHWLLTPGRNDVARLRGYMRVKAWRDCRTPAERRFALKVAAKMPARALREARAAVHKHGAYVEQAHGVSSRRQLMQLWWLWVRHGINQPEVYYAFGLYRPGQLRRAPYFFQGFEDDRLFRMLSFRTAREQAELLLDKAKFEQWLEAQGLPTVRTLLELEDRRTVRSAIETDGLPPCDLFSKPNDGLQGIGTQRWLFDGDGWVGGDGKRRTEGALIAELREASAGGGILLQELVTNHPALRPVAARALSTVRVLTLRGLDGAVRVVTAVAKLPTGDAATDHMKYGGIAAPVDLATGRLGKAVAKDEARFVVPCERHPDSGALLEGFQLPHWQSVVDTAVRAHELLDGVLCIGWDIAILERGPIIVEGNDNPGHTSSQLPTGVAYGETDVARTLLARLEQSFSRRRVAAPVAAGDVTNAAAGRSPEASDATS